MGANGEGGRADKTAAFPSTSSLTSFTIQGWYQTDSTAAIGAGARLMETNTFNLRGNDGVANSGRLVIQVNGSNLPSALNTFTETESWVFFAVTYDGTATTNNVNFYKGSLTGAVANMGTHTLNQGTTGINDKLTIGGQLNVNTRSFDGLMDNFRLFGTTSGSGGVLTQTELENFRAMDVIPEPSSLVLIGIGALSMVLLIRRRHS
jgi:hypothetical protein